MDQLPSRATDNFFWMSFGGPYVGGGENLLLKLGGCKCEGVMCQAYGDRKKNWINFWMGENFVI